MHQKGYQKLDKKILINECKHTLENKPKLKIPKTLLANKIFCKL